MASVVGMASVAPTKSMAATCRGVALGLLVGLLAASCTAEGSTAPDPTPGTSTPGTASPGSSCVAAQPAPASGGGAVFDAVAQRVVMVTGGGAAGPAETQLTVWSWDGSCWQAAGSAGPAGRELGVVAYDDSRHRLVVYGGRGAASAPLTDLHEWMATGGTPCRPRYPMAPATTSPASTTRAPDRSSPCSVTTAPDSH